MRSFRLIGRQLALTGLATCALLAVLNAGAEAAYSWVPAAPMSTPRVQHLVAKLRSGKVFVTGGVNGTQAQGACTGGEFNTELLTSSEIYDPLTNTWTPAAPSLAPHASSLGSAPYTNALTLPDGRVLIADTGSASPSEIYDPETDTWELTATFGGVASYTHALLLPNGEVFVAASTASTQILRYDPGLDTWTTSAASVPNHTDWALSLADGRVFLIYEGGAAIYDPTTDQLAAASTPSLGWEVVGNPVLLPDGRVLVADDGPSSMVYDPTVDTWITAPASLPQMTMSGTGFRGVASTLFPGGAAGFVGGAELFDDPCLGGDYIHAETQIFEPETMTWAAGPDLGSPRGYTSGVVLDGGDVMITGGMYIEFDATCSQVCRSPILRGPSEAIRSSVEIYKDAAPSGTACSLNTDCSSGSCVSAICCTTACGLNPCQSGACDTGTCQSTNLPDGTACGTNPCQSGVCKVGACESTNLPDGTRCGPNSICGGGNCQAEASSSSSGSASTASSSSSSSGSGSSSSSSSSTGSTGSSSSSSTSLSSSTSSSGAGGVGGGLGAGGAGGGNPAGAGGAPSSAPTSPSSCSADRGAPRDPGAPLLMLLSLALAAFRHRQTRRLPNAVGAS